MNENLEKLENFFKSNLKIKQIIIKSSPNDMDVYDEGSIFKYADKLSESLNELEQEFLNIVTNINVSIKQDKIKQIFETYRLKLQNCNYKYENLANFYKVCFTSMSENLITSTKKELIGYYSHGNINKPLKKCTSINEYLHVIHSYITNQEAIYQSMPKINTRKYSHADDINLYGKENKIAKEIFDNIPIKSENGPTDIIGLDNKVLIMIRDRGHALTIEIDKEKDEIYVKYFIPKICNVEMVNDLKGVRKVKDTSIGTIGEFKTKEENIALDIINFIEKVPTDMDMIINRTK